MSKVIKAEERFDSIVVRRVRKVRVRRMDTLPRRPDPCPLTQIIWSKAPSGCRTEMELRLWGDVEIKAMILGALLGGRSLNWLVITREKPKPRARKRK